MPESFLAPLLRQSLRRLIPERYRCPHSDYIHKNLLCEFLLSGFRLEQILERKYFCMCLCFPWHKSIDCDKINNCLKTFLLPGCKSKALFSDPQVHDQEVFPLSSSIIHLGSPGWQSPPPCEESTQCKLGKLLRARLSKVHLFSDFVWEGCLFLAWLFLFSGRVRPRQGTEICNFGAPSPLEFFAFSPVFYVQFSKTSPLKSGESSEKSSGEKSCHVCGCHGFFRP